MRWVEHIVRKLSVEALVNQIIIILINLPATLMPVRPRIFSIAVFYTTARPPEQQTSLCKAESIAIKVTETRYVCTF